MIIYNTKQNRNNQLYVQSLFFFLALERRWFLAVLSAVIGGGDEAPFLAHMGMRRLRKALPTCEKRTKRAAREVLPVEIAFQKSGYGPRHCQAGVFHARNYLFRRPSVSVGGRQYWWRRWRVSRKRRCGDCALARREKALTNRSDDDRHGWGLCHFDGSRTSLSRSTAMAAFWCSLARLLSQPTVVGTWHAVVGVADGT